MQCLMKKWNWQMCRLDLIQLCDILIQISNGRKNQLLNCEWKFICRERWGLGGVENSCPEKFFTLMDWLFLHLQQWKWTKSRARKVSWIPIVGGPGSRSETHRRLEAGKQGRQNEKLSDLQRWAASIDMCSLWFPNTFSTSGPWKQCAMQRAGSGMN